MLFRPGGISELPVYPRFERQYSADFARHGNLPLTGNRRLFCIVALRIPYFTNNRLTWISGGEVVAVRFEKKKAG
jgi:hypothetical protein